MIFSTFIMLATLTAVPSPAPAMEPLAAAPQFVRTPNANDILLAYPREAFRNGLNGTVVLDCASGTDGGLIDCRVVSESPAGHRFGLAALRLSTRYRLQSPPPDTAPPTAKRVRFGLSFATSDD